MSLDTRLDRLRLVYRRPDALPREESRAGRLSMREEFELYELLTKLEEGPGLTATERVRCHALCSRWENRPTRC